MNLRLIVVLLALFGAAACSEPLEFADWTIPVPEGTEVFGYAPVPIDDRGDARIELVDDLVVRSRGDDERYLLYRPRDVDVGPDGSIYVLDAGDFNVKVYDAAGEHVRTFSQRGQGPGELSRPTSAAIAGDRYVVNDGGTRMIVWSLDGEYLGEHRLPVRPNARPFIGLDDGGVMIGYLEGRGDDIRRASDRASCARSSGACRWATASQRSFSICPSRSCRSAAGRVASIHRCEVRLEATRRREAASST